MSTLAKVLVGWVGISHLGFLILEMFFWTTPQGRKIFRTTQEFANASSALAANQGLYNGFLSAGLFYGLMTHDPQVQYTFQLFFLICVIIAGVYGAWSVNRRIFVIQALPGILALIAVLVTRPV